MRLVKKIFFSIPFVIGFISYCLFLNKFLENPNLLFSIDSQTILLSIYIIITALCTGFFFALFITMSQDIKIIIGSFPAVLLTSYLLLPESSRVIIAIGSCILFLLVSLSLKHSLNSYLSFTPNTLLSPYIKRVVTFLFLFGSIALYLSINQDIQQQGFSIPQTLIDTITKTIPQQQSSNIIDEQLISSEQIEQLQNNPDLLKQFGLTKEKLNQIVPKGETINPQQLIKSQIKQQIENFIKPFESFIPIIFAMIFFFNLRFVTSIFEIFLGPLISLVFLILDKTKFTDYTTETRLVRKLIV